MLIERIGNKEDRIWKIDIRPAQSLARKGVPWILAAVLGYSSGVSVKKVPEFVYYMQLKAEYAQMQKKNFTSEISYLFAVNRWGGSAAALLQDYNEGKANPASIDSKIMEALSILNEGVENRHLHGLRTTYPFVNEGIGMLLEAKYRNQIEAVPKQQGSIPSNRTTKHSKWLMGEIGRTYDTIEFLLGLKMEA